MSFNSIDQNELVEMNIRAELEKRLNQLKNIDYRGVASRAGKAASSAYGRAREAASSTYGKAGKAASSAYGRARGAASSVHGKAGEVASKLRGLDLRDKKTAALLGALAVGAAGAGALGLRRKMKKRNRAAVEEALFQHFADNIWG